MGNNVFANGREISCKKADGKSICCFPDVCFTPPDKVPPTPPGVPIPYPNTGMAKDTTSGSKKVKISGQEVLLRNKSYFKKTIGNEAGCATKKGLVTSKTTGKAYFNAWSMDVKIEGQNVVRHLDLTTHNHGSFPSNTAPWPYMDSMGFKKGGVCDGVDKKLKLVPYKSKDKNGNDKLTCSPDTGHHLIPGRCMRTRTTGRGGEKLKEPAYPEGCSHNKAPCVCVDNENQYDGTHRDCHAVFDPVEHAEAAKPPKNQMTYKKARDAAAESAKGVNGRKLGKKQLECVKAQLDNYYKNCLKNDDGSVSKNAKLNAQSGKAGLVLKKKSSTGNLG